MVVEETESMQGGRVGALNMLRPPDFFTHLRGVLTRVGLAGEEKYGVGVFFVATSRVLRNPLRLCVREKTEGGANYVVRRVAKLLEPGSFVELSPSKDQSWSRFAKNPEHMAVYLPEGKGAWSMPRQVRLEIAEHQLGRVVPVERDGRVVEERVDIEAPFACISAEYRADLNNASRWLTMILGKPPQQTGPRANPILRTIPMGEEELLRWHRLQELAQERAQLGIVLPEWADLVIEETCKDERAARHLPAFLQAWKTMAVVRSLPWDKKEILRRGQVHANFTDFAAAGSLLRGVFREGHRFPSTGNIFNRAFPVGEENGFVHPLTGKGIRYIHRNEDHVR
jgi:hypothetical protein